MKLNELATVTTDDSILTIMHERSWVWDGWDGGGPNQLIDIMKINFVIIKLFCFCIFFHKYQDTTSSHSQDKYYG